jgi:hypothetical protein
VLEVAVDVDLWFVVEAAVLAFVAGTDDFEPFV